MGFGPASIDDQLFPKLNGDKGPKGIGRGFNRPYGEQLPFRFEPFYQFARLLLEHTGRSSDGWI